MAKRQQGHFLEAVELQESLLKMRADLKEVRACVRSMQMAAATPLFLCPFLFPYVNEAAYPRLHEPTTPGPLTASLGWLVGCRLLVCFGVCCRRVAGARACVRGAGGGGQGHLLREAAAETFRHVFDFSDEPAKH